MVYSSEITKIIAEGSRAYSSKDYELASEKYGEACELYSSKQGEEDADLLFLYGKALFQNGVNNSEVFGGAKVEEPKDDEEEGEENEEVDDSGQFQFHNAEPVEQEIGEQGIEEQGSRDVQQQETNEETQQENTPIVEEEQDDQEEKTDFEIAWEILDVTRALFEEKVDKSRKESKIPYLSSESEETDDEYILNTKKLSETYDILGEVSLEAENFKQASEDLSKCLELRKKLYPPNSSLISESHYKLALALEFNVEDPDSRKKAAEQINLAIETVEERSKSETDAEKLKNNKEMVQELTEKYQELLKDPNEEIKSQQLNIIKGILGEEVSKEGTAMGESIVNNLNSMVKKKKKEAPINDLSNVVRKRKPSSSNGGVEKKQK